MSYDLVVIGGGPAGIRSAHRARERGATAAIVGMGAWGGTAVNDGVAPARTLAQAARLMRDLHEQCPKFGIQVSGVKLDFAALMASVRTTVGEIHRNHRFAETLREAGVDLIRSTEPARFLDAHRLEAGEQVLEGQHFMICTGGRAREIQFPGSD